MTLLTTAPDDKYIDTPLGAIDVTQVATWTVIIVASGFITALVLHYWGPR